MAVNYNGFKISKNIKDIREARIYIYQLDIKKFNEPLDVSNLEQYNIEINDTLRKNKNPEETNNLIKKIDELCANTLLPIKIFNWIKNEDRACYYVWGKVRLLDVNSFKSIKINIPHRAFGNVLGENKKTSIAYDELNLNKYPSSTSERFEIIIHLFDLMDLNIERKEEILNDIKNEWGNTFSNKNNFRWLDIKNKELCEWAWNYIKKYSDFCSYLSPVNDTERYLCFYAAFDLWSASQDTKKLFSLNINKANSQQKFRAGIKNKKALNTFIDEKSKNRLDLLSKKHSMKLNQMIEYLIDKEFKNDPDN